MWIIFVILGMLFFGADQWTKLWALEHLSNIETTHGVPEWNGTLIDGVPHVFEFVYKSNTAGAMGIHFPWARVILIIATFVLLIALVIYMWNPKNRTPLLWAAASFLVGGGMGNLVDRIFRGYVPDFIRFVHNAYFPYVFNVADIVVCIGAILLAIHILHSGKTDAPERSGEDGGNI